jgi:steroid delta-isomerase-like uncharacterized protein
MNKTQPPSGTHLFTVRLWLEHLGEGQTEWRGEVRSVVSGETRYFRDWPRLVALVQAMLPKKGDALKEPEQKGEQLMSTEEKNKAIVRRFYEVVFDKKRVDLTDELFARDYLDHAPFPGQGPGLEGAKQKWATVIAATPDLRVQIEDIVAEGDRVVVRWAYEGTHLGTLIGIPPTGKRFRISGISICRLAEGKIAEDWDEADRLGLMQQLGVIPAPEPGGSQAPL